MLNSVSLRKLPLLSALVLTCSTVACSDSTDPPQKDEDETEDEEGDAQEPTGRGGFGGAQEGSPAPTLLPMPGQLDDPDEPKIPLIDQKAEEGCLSNENPLLELGEGIGSSFRAFEPGDTLQVDFASQAGIYAHVTLDLDGVSLEEVSGIQSALLVAESPVAEGESTGSSVRCTGSTARFEMIMPVNVHTHPTLPSLVELDGASGRVTATVELRDGSTVEAGTDVMINL